MSTGIYLIGSDAGSGFTSEVIDASGNTESSFDLTDETWFVRFFSNNFTTFTTLTHIEAFIKYWPV